MFLKKLREYAQVLVHTGLQVKPGQTVVIRTPIECAELARLCIEEAYAAGCKDVIMNWRDDFEERQRLLYADDEALDVCPEAVRIAYEQGLSENGVMLEFYIMDPDSMKGVPTERIMRARKGKMGAISQYYNHLNDNTAVMCTASPPIKAWAKKTFPELSEEEALQKQWDLVFQTLHIKGDGKAVDYWKEHFAQIDVYGEALTRYQFKALHYRNSLGTDLIIELPENHLWSHCLKTTKNNRSFIQNLPSEEIWTVPRKDGVNGIVYGSRPLIYQGFLITDFWIRFENGKAVESHAENGDEYLKELIAFDEGSCYLGEAALISIDSDISKMNRVFYNPLYDENASCHLALGEGLGMCVKGGENMTREELDRAGVNTSGVHVDFMIGTEDLNIVGITAEGEEVPIFVNGLFSEQMRG